MDEIMLKIPYEPPGHLSTELMSLALDGWLDSSQQQSFDAHLQVCEVCRDQWLIWHRISHALQVEPFSAPPASFALRVNQAIQRDEKYRERLWGGLVLVGGTLAVWTVLFVGLALTLTVGTTVATGTKPDLIEYLGFGQQVLTLFVRSLTTIRDGLLAMMPGPGAAVGLAAALAVLALIWLRLVRSSGQRAGLPGGQTSAPTNNR